MKQTINGWIIWLFGGVFSFGIDFLLRTLFGREYSDQGAGYIFPALIAGFAILAVYMLFKGVSFMQWWIRPFPVIIQCVVGYGILVYASLFYVCHSGIDCL